MKKLSSVILVLTAICFVFFTSVFLYIDSNQSKFEFTIEWIYGLQILLIFGTLSLFLGSLLYKNIVSKTYTWQRILLTILFAIILAIGVVLVFLNKRNIHREEFAVGIVFFVVSVTLLLLFYILKNKNWIKWLFTILSSLLVLLSIFMIVVFGFINYKTEYIEPDLCVSYKKVDSNEKIVQRGSKDYPYMVHIKSDYGIFRVYDRVDENYLPDGVWEKLDNKGKAILVIEIKDGVAISMNPIIPKDAILVSSLDSLQYIIEHEKKDSLTIYLKGKMNWGNTLFIKDKSNIKLNCYYSLDTTVILTEGILPIQISNSNNISISGLHILASKSNGFIQIKGSKNVIINDCILFGKVVNGIKSAEDCENITISNTTISDYLEYGIVSESENIELKNNRFFIDGVWDYQNKFMIKGYKFTKEKQLDYVAKTLLGDRYGSGMDNVSEDYIKTELYGLAYHDDVYLQYYSNSSTWISENLCSDCGSYNYEDFVKIFTSMPFSFSTRQSFHKTWTWNDQSARFKHVNPEVFVWLRDNINITPNDMILGQAVQKYYDQTLKKMMRVYSTSYMRMRSSDIGSVDELFNNFLDNNQDLQNFMYENITQHLNPGIDIQESSYPYEDYYESEGDYSEGEYSEGDYSEGEYSESDGDRTYINFTGTTVEVLPEINISLCQLNYIYSFWCRREADGSATEIFRTMMHFIQIWDPEWAVKLENGEYDSTPDQG